MSSGSGSCARGRGLGERRGWLACPACSPSSPAQSPCPARLPAMPRSAPGLALWQPHRACFPSCRHEAPGEKRRVPSIQRPCLRRLPGLHVCCKQVVRRLQAPPPLRLSPAGRSNSATRRMASRRAGTACAGSSVTGFEQAAPRQHSASAAVAEATSARLLRPHFMKASAFTAASWYGSGSKATSTRGAAATPPLPLPPFLNAL